MKCKQRKKCLNYDENSYTCNYNAGCYNDDVYYKCYGEKKKNE